MGRVSLVATALGLLVSTSSLGCEGKVVIFEDDFKDDLGGWESDTALKFGADGLTVTLAPAAEVYHRMNTSFAAKDGDYCMDVAFPSRTEANASVALRFWSADNANYYVFQASQDGKASLWRRANNTWIKAWDKEAPAIKRDPGATNRLRVVAKGNLVSTYINGGKVRDTRAQSPTGDSRFGFNFELVKASPEEEGRTFAIKNYKVTTAE
jgi:hypothetical protein